MKLDWDTAERGYGNFSDEVEHNRTLIHVNKRPPREAVVAKFIGHFGCNDKKLEQHMRQILTTQPARSNLISRLPMAQKVTTRLVTSPKQAIVSAENNAVTSQDAMNPLPEAIENRVQALYDDLQWLNEKTQEFYAQEIADVMNANTMKTLGESLNKLREGIGQDEPYFMSSEAAHARYQRIEISLAELGIRLDQATVDPVSWANRTERSSATRSFSY